MHSGSSFAGLPIRSPTRGELRDAYRYARALGLKFETITHEKYAGEPTTENYAIALGT